MARILSFVFLAFALAALGCANTTPISFDTTPTPAPTPRLSVVKPATAPPRTTYKTYASRDVTVRRRSEWANAAPITSRLDPMGTPMCITVHHEGDVASPMSASGVCAHLRAVRASQIRPKGSGGLGAGDIAYHFIVDPSGDVWEGRPICYQGAHAGNFDANQRNIGICLLGNFSIQYVSAAQKQSLQKLLVTLMNRYNLSPNQVYTHREIKRRFGLPATECPGTHLQADMDEMRVKLRYANR